MVLTLVNLKNLLKTLHGKHIHMNHHLGLGLATILQWNQASWKFCCSDMKQVDIYLIPLYVETKYWCYTCYHNCLLEPLFTVCVIFKDMARTGKSENDQSY